jgi:hypothetical protein
MVGHIPHFIRRFGSPMNFDTATFETAHRSIVKDLFVVTNKSEDAASQMMNHLSIIDRISAVIDDGERNKNKSQLSNGSGADKPLARVDLFHEDNEAESIEDAESEDDDDVTSADDSSSPRIIFSKEDLNIEGRQISLWDDLLRLSGLRTRENVRLVRSIRQLKCFKSQLFVSS